MSNLCAILFIISSMAAAVASAGPAAPKGREINFGFYLHDTVSGDNPTMAKIAQSPLTEKSQTRFGTMIMQDDPLTEGPDPKSKLIGRSQGFYGYAGIENEIALLMAMSFAFTDGPYKGSSISVLGRNLAFSPQREMPVVGGTGVFRLARGFVVLETYQYNNSTKDAIVHYNVTILI